MTHALLLLLISLLYIPSLIQTQCNSELPDNSIAILDSNTHHTVSGGETFPVDFIGWNRIEVDSIIYHVSTGESSLDIFFRMETTYTKYRSMWTYILFLLSNKPSSYLNRDTVKNSG